MKSSVWELCEYMSKTLRRAQVISFSRRAYKDKEQTKITLSLNIPTPLGQYKVFLYLMTRNMHKSKHAKTLYPHLKTVHKNIHQSQVCRHQILLRLFLPNLLPFHLGALLESLKWTFLWLHWYLLCTSVQRWGHRVLESQALRNNGGTYIIILARSNRRHWALTWGLKHYAAKQYSKHDLKEKPGCFKATVNVPNLLLMYSSIPQEDTINVLALPLLEHETHNYQDYLHYLSIWGLWRL